MRVCRGGGGGGEKEMTGWEEPGLATKPPAEFLRDRGRGSLIEAARHCTGARLCGLMLIPPSVDDPEEARPWFRHLRELRDRLVDAGAPADMLTHLSMGMSHDFPVAIEEGATLVRVGSAIFGARHYATAPGAGDAPGI